MSESDGDNDAIHEEKINLVSRYVVRYVLSYSESQSTIITRTRLSTVIREACSTENIKNVRFDKIFKAANKILLEAYGYRLVGLHPKLNKESNSKKPSQPRAQTQTQTQTQTQSQPQTQTQNTPEGIELENDLDCLGYPDLVEKAQSFILTNTLPPPPERFRTLLLDQCGNTYEERVIDEQYIGDDVSLLSGAGARSCLSTDRHLATQGLTLVILAVILFSKNNILHQELVQQLQKFGVPKDGHKIPIVDQTVEELLKLLDRQEYILKIEERAKDGTQETIFYKVGRRTQVEFDRQALLNTCKELLGLDHEQIGIIGKSIDLSINDAYKVCS